MCLTTRLNSNSDGFRSIICELRTRSSKPSQYARGIATGAGGRRKSSSIVCLFKNLSARRKDGGLSEVSVPGVLSSPNRGGELDHIGFGWKQGALWSFPPTLLILSSATVSISAMVLLPNLPSALFLLCTAMAFSFTSYRSRAFLNNRLLEDSVSGSTSSS